MLFGGGTVYGCGEDSLFLSDSLKKGLKLYASPFVIGTVGNEVSTWFSGYNQKFFHDKGALFACMCPAFAKLLCLQMCLRHKEMFTDLPMKEAYSIMQNGIREFKNNKGFMENA